MKESKLYKQQKNNQHHTYSNQMNIKSIKRSKLKNQNKNVNSIRMNQNNKKREVLIKKEKRTNKKRKQ